uniref:Neuropeptide-Like Protein n=1 Tax=Caenorhabditis japonica TaxID=281687 RepID=A0A8R1HUN4_CAEJA
MLTASSLLGSLLLTTALLNTSRASLTAGNMEETQIPTRQLRSFPYSVSFYRMLGHDRHLRPYYGANDEVAALIDSMNNEELVATRARRNDGLRGYACRFKFCRIYDA